MALLALALTVTAVSFFMSLSLARAPGMSCEEHPAYSSALKPVLIRAWKMPDGQPSKSQDVVYMPRYKKHQYTPLSGNRNKYRALDYFHLVLFKTEQHNPITFYFQRPAKVYLFVDPTDPNAAINAADTPQLDGWKSEGFAELTKGSSPLKYGIYDTVERVLPTVVYVFSKLSSGTENVVMAPSSAAIKSSVTNLTIGGKYMNFWIAESNGKASKPVGKFQGKSVAPNKKCPDALHNAWYALDDNTEDADTRGVKFATWHPRWDPCFWCAYDHEHGSAAKILTGYTPKYDYVAWKNSRQDEKHSGFKSFVAKKGNFFIYYNMHAQSSNIGRALVRFHTITLAIIDATTKELLFEVGHKADFGFLGVRNVTKRPIIPLRQEDYELKRTQRGKATQFRALNVVDIGNLNSNYRFRTNPIHGAYEEWATQPICTNVKKNGAVKADIERPVTGIKSATEVRTKVNLGRSFRGKFIRNVGMSRNIRFNGASVGAHACRFEGGEKPEGYFYTDPDGRKVLENPGPTAVRQFIKRGFRFSFSYASETADEWLGLYQEGEKGFFKDSGFGVNPDVN